jgi:hypothetical protein
MSLYKSHAECQIPSLQYVSEGYAKIPPLSLSGCLKLALQRRLTPDRKRAIKRHSNRLIDRFLKLIGRSKSPSAPVTGVGKESLQAGDLVRVRSRKEIEATLGHWKDLKGCSFMPEMWPYCGTTQRVFKRVERFLDERDLRVKKCKGIIFLDGVICQGTAVFGRCDRSCFYFWREEWLEKLDGQVDSRGSW